jgi:hypothetical protein
MRRTESVRWPPHARADPAELRLLDREPAEVRRAGDPCRRRCARAQSSTSTSSPALDRVEHAAALALPDTVAQRFASSSVSTLTAHEKVGKLRR